MQKRLYLLVAMLMVMTTAAVAQITTSGLAGSVSVKGSDEAVIGATITAVHEPSGTRYQTVTNVNGRFNIQGMRNGGPYTVSVSYIGFQKKSYTGITLQLGEVYDLKVQLSEDANELGEVVVTAKASKFSAEKTGASTNISRGQIENMPTAYRSITDITRLSPYANGMNIGGGDGRSTNFTLDGANLNNSFGLSSSLPGGGTPVSIDAIDEIQVVVSPFDVRQSNFIGGGINAVTKSGTNTFKGTAYMYYTNENMHGNRINNEDLAARSRDRLTTYGATLGGPIIKDKLFFFGNVEYSKVPTVVNRWMPSTDGQMDPDLYISRTTVSDMQTVKDFMMSKYGYDTGSYNSFPSDEETLRLLGRIDWNITNNHHLALRVNHTNSSDWHTTNGNSVNSGITRHNGMNRISQYSMAFANSMYKFDHKVTTLSADLNSRFGDKFANELLVTYSNIEDPRDTNSSYFPFIDIMAGKDDSGKQLIEPYMSLGYELFSWNNNVQQKQTNIVDNFTWYAGSHKVMAGLAFEHQLANNSYMRCGTGYYRYSSLEDFLNGAAPESVSITYGYNGNTNPTAQVAFNQLSLYLQDDWNITRNFKLNYGIRFDRLAYDEDDVMTNNAILALDFGGRHIDTGKWPDAKIQYSPRVGFSWDVFGDKSLKLRGGTGLFAGRLPLVYFTNMPTNSGMIQNTVTATTTYDKNGNATPDPRLANFAGGIITDASEIISRLGGATTINPEDGVVGNTVAGVDPDFKMPQVWKTSVGVDYVVPVSFPLSISGEFTYVRRINDVIVDNYNIKPVDDSWGHLVGADNRLYYPTDHKYYSTSRSFNACVLTNTKHGHGYIANFTVNAEPVKDLRLMASYTFTEQKEMSGLPGNAPYSTWQGNYSVNGPNHLTVQNSRYVIPHRVIASVSYTWKKHDHFSLFYQGYSPSGYSYVYQNDVNGDGINNDLMYIPRDDSEIHFTSEDDRIAFWQYLNQDDYLKNHRGEYAEAYSARAPFVHRFDFRWAHDFTLKVGSTHHKLQLSADISNIGNLFNSKWGVEKNMLKSNNGQILKVDKIVDGVPYFSMRKYNGEYPTSTFDYDHSYGQCWKLQIGVKYFFN